MARPSYKRGVAEVFGVRPENATNDEQMVWQAHMCPFVGELCNKKSQHKDYDSSIPFGACSVWHRGDSDSTPQPYVVCPTRFLQSNRVLYDTQRLFSRRANTSLRIVQEISFDEIGRIDEVLAQIDDNTGDVIDFVLLEIMACSTTSTGDVLKSFHAALSGATVTDRLAYGINYRQVLSRMVIQALSKIRACEQWGTHLVWAVQDVLYNYMHSTTMLDLPVVSLGALDDPTTHDLPPLLFFIYSMRETDHGKFNLQLNQIRGGTTDRFAEVIEPRRIPTRVRMVSGIRRKILEGKSELLTTADLADLAKLLGGDASDATNNPSEG